MMGFNCKWLPELILFSAFENFNIYLEHLYRIFRADFILSKPLYKSKPVNIRYHPIDIDRWQRKCLYPSDVIY